MAKKSQSAPLPKDEIASSKEGGTTAGQMQSVPFEQSNASQENAKQAVDMATPDSPSDDQPAADPEEDLRKQADRIYAEHSTNPSVGSDLLSAPPQASEVKLIDAKEGEIYLRVKVGHPSGMFRVGQHVITRAFQKFDLSADDAKEVNSEGPQAWLEKGDAAAAEQDAKLGDEIKSAQRSGANEI